MVERYIKFLGLNQTIELLDANERPLTPSIRINTLKVSINALKEKLAKKSFKLAPIEWIPYGFNILNQPQNLGSLHEFLQGYYYLQNVASMLPAHILNPKPNDVVIDMCAAPGSKATQLAQIMKNKGTLMLIDKNMNRIPALEINLRRMGILNSMILNYDSINLERLNIRANKILLDVPCTGEGLIRQDKSRKLSKSINDINKMASIQKRLLKAGLGALKTGGELLYSTCSIAPEENEFVINSVMQNNPQYSIERIKFQYGLNGYNKIYGTNLMEDLSNSQRLFPHIHNTIGFYICLIKKL